MLHFVLRRLAISLLVLVVLTLAAALLVRLVPGDPVTTVLGMNYTEADAQRIRAELGLDRSAIEQYGAWLWGVARGDLGTSLTSGTPVTQELGAALPVTAELMVLALIFAILIGVPLGVLSAMYRNGLIDYGASVAGLIGLSVPGFWLGAMLILLFDIQLGWTNSTTELESLFAQPFENLKRMALPTVSLGLAVAAVIMRMSRTAMIDVLHEDYMRTAEAKGVARRWVIFKHGLRNALIPVLTITGIQAAYLLGGSVVIEEVFSLNGLGRLVYRSVSERDYPVVQACILVIGGGFLLINLIVDLLYAAVDPRIRYD